MLVMGSTIFLFESWHIFIWMLKYGKQEKREALVWSQSQNGLSGSEGFLLQVCSTKKSPIRRERRDLGLP